MKGIAFKVTYNDGGANGSLFGGFNGVCSDRIMVDNVRERKMTYCSTPDNPCRKYIDGSFAGPRPAMPPCYEGTLFNDRRFQFGGGVYHHGPKAGEPIPVKGIEPGDIAFLTTLLPGKQQHERIVFGCFRVARTPTLHPSDGYIIESDGTMDVRLPDEVAGQMGFWRYFQNSDGSKKWGTGLFRHLDQLNAHALLGDLLGLLGDYPQRDVLLRAIGSEVPPHPVQRLPAVAGTAFGGGGFAGGESGAHKRLKELVAASPEKIGLPPDAKAVIEFPYLSGDQVDIKFDLPDGSFAVVEIETIDGWTGAHQCIKYRALLEAAEGHVLGSGKVRAVLVAHLFDDKTRAFARKYGIRVVELRV
jgi:hypothetical protein